jgi:glycosyltransferase involved in cell wall biosynthesis
MVVGVLSTSFPRHSGDFAGCFVADDVRRLLRDPGSSVEVLAAGDGPAGVTTTREGALAVTRISTGVASASALFYGQGAPEALEAGGARAWIQATHFWAALCRQAQMAAPRWQALVSHWLLPCGLAAIVAATGRPHRAYAHSGDVALLERLPLGGALAAWIAASGAELVFVSDDLKTRFASLAGRVVGRVESLAPDPQLFAPPTAEESQSARRRRAIERPTIIAVGRLVPIKGFDLLIDACAPLADRIDLIIVGDGPERAALRDRALRRGVSLRLPGMVPRSEVRGWLTAADLYAQPSRATPSGRTEGLPLATLEARAMGLPVVAARSGGLVELAGRDGGVTLFPPGDARSLREAIRSRLALGGAPSGRA